jgi:hypothetical protein
MNDQTEKLASTFDESFTLFLSISSDAWRSMDAARVREEPLTPVMLRGYQTGVGGWRFCSGNQQSGLEIVQKA